MENKKHLIIVVIILFFLLSFRLWALKNESKDFNVGLRILDFEYPSDKGKEIITVAVWYPTYETSKRFVYQGVKDYESKVASPPSYFAKTMSFEDLADIFA
ncbi:MAG: hypothetical protein COX49_10025 [bacterium (Candidatus Stahlbacteria) CG23_combo_of_CG06-09_8_20_14_all_40_9]|nr:MAG: hypothetical protein COX49_10025 [bacterium (Candidatus Stahlbacteria) CG23_combo_of_CG06-09_8_20_14_all_40_9]